MPVVRIPYDPDVGLAPERAWDVTASVGAAIPGLHPYVTGLELYEFHKHGIALPRFETEAMLKGRILEPSFPGAVKRERPAWRLVPCREYVRDPVRRLGCTADFIFTDEHGREGPLQAKTMAQWVFDKYWGEYPPTWVAIQNTIEMMLHDADVGAIAAMIVDGYHFKTHIYEVPRHPAAEQRIHDMVAKYWRDLEAGIPPKPDYERDGALIALMYPREVEGKVVDLRHDNRLPELLDESERLATVIKDAEAAKKIADNEVKFKMGDAESALVAGWRVTFKQQTRKAHMVKESAFRVLRAKRDDAA